MTWKVPKQESQIPLDLATPPPKLAKVRTPAPSLKEKEMPMGLPQDRLPGVTRWVILGVDGSLSSTGFSTMLVGPDGQSWHGIGSVSPGTRDEHPWIRSKAMGLHVCSVLRSKEVVDFCQEAPTGLLLSYEAPTVGADALQIANMGLRMALRSDIIVMGQFSEHWELMTNAATMRTIMGLVEKGSQNKKENKAKAWTYVGEKEFPNMDNDSCDATIFTMLGLWTTRLFRDGIEGAEAPERFKRRFCDLTGDYKVVTRFVAGDKAGKVVPKGAKKGLRADEITRERVATDLHGVLHRANYWFPYKESPREVKVRDSRIKTARLPTFTYTV